MQYARCKCGAHETWTTDSIPRCTFCDKCNTTLATSPNGHKDTPEPHQWRKRFDSNTGERKNDYCAVCHKQRPAEPLTLRPATDLTDGAN